jgi:hypothetical protein
MKKISQKTYEDFKNQYLFDAIKIPSYRFGQAFLNTFPEFDSSLHFLDSVNDGDANDHQTYIWSSTNIQNVQKMIEKLFVEKS